MPAERGRALWSAGERSRWQTLDSARIVLAVARTFTSTVRLLDALATAFRGDPRVQVLFAFDESSVFAAEVGDLLARAQVRRVGWDEIEGLDYDLVVTASENVDAERMDAPIVVLPHGIGFHKFVPDSHGPGNRVSGLIRPEYAADERISLAISHPGQREQVRAHHPEAVNRCVVIGDATYDRLIASLPLREHYRHLLGVRRDQRLVVLTSTWGPGSLLAAGPGLATRLLRELPFDEYRVARVLHPNVRAWHGEAHLAQSLAGAYAGGLIRVPADEGWQGALIAADVVIGDHGSVTLYAAALDRPILLGAPPAPTTVPGTPPEILARTADRLNPGQALRDRLDRAMDEHRPGRFAGLAADMFARRGEAVPALRTLLYERLALPVPTGRAPMRAVPGPRPECDEPRSFIVHSRPAEPGTIELRRFPAAAGEPPAPFPGTYRHLSVSEDEPDRLLAENASLIVRHRPTDPGEAATWLDETLRLYPGAMMAVAALPGGCLATLRDGTRITAEGTPDPGLAASAIYTCVRAGTPTEGTITLKAGTAGRLTLTTSTIR